jgi:hypothetical protein
VKAVATSIALFATACSAIAVNRYDPDAPKDVEPDCWTGREGPILDTIFATGWLANAAALGWVIATKDVDDDGLGASWSWSKSDVTKIAAVGSLIIGAGYALSASGGFQWSRQCREAKRAWGLRSALSTK